jgi:mRNA-degrading endonuclease RelE of RelBE toxin-antitoxin system
MEKFAIWTAKSAWKEIARIPLPWRARVINILDVLAQNPFIGAPMKEKYRGKYKIRIWPYRIIYSIDKKARIINILEAGHRGGMSYR